MFVNFTLSFQRATLKEYPVDSEAPTNLQYKIPLTEKPTPINSVVFAGTTVKMCVFCSEFAIDSCV